MGNSKARTPARASGPVTAALVVLGALLGGGLTAQVKTPAPDAPFVSVNGATVPYGVFYDALQDAAGREVAEQIILDELARQRAEKLGLLPTAEEIDAELARVIRVRFGSAAQYARWMIENGLSEDGVRRELAAELTDLRLRTQGVDAGEPKLREFFEQHRELYDKPTRVRFRQIVVESKEKADTVLAQLQSGEVNFFSAAMRHSLDPAAAETGGLVGPLPLPLIKEQAAPLAEALLGLTVNQYTHQPVEHAQRWYLLLLVDREEGAAVAFGDVQPQVERDYLLDQAQPEQEFYESLRLEAKVSGLPGRYRLLEQWFGPAPAAPEMGPVPEE